MALEGRRVGSGWAHETAVVVASAIGEGTHIWHFSHVMAGARIGARCTIGQSVHIASNVVVGNGCKIQNGAQLFEGVELLDDVFIGPHVVFTNVLTPRAFVNRRAEFAPTRVGRGASIGANATILCGVTVGQYALIGAGAVVTQDVPPHRLVVGNPTRALGWVCQCGERLSADAWPGVPSSSTCGRCNAKYSFGADGIRLDEQE